MKKILFLLLAAATMIACKKPIETDEIEYVEGDKFTSQVSGIVASNDSAFVISAYAGSGTAGDINGTAGSPLTAQFRTPEGLVFDSNGNMFVADCNNHVIRKITPSGNVSVFAGLAGTSGAANGAATIARFYNPIRVAIDAANNLYVADRGNARIRKVTPAGVVSTIAGTSPGTGSTQFTWPTDVAVSADGTKVYVADSQNHRIQKVLFNGTSWATSTLAGSTTPGHTDATGSAAKFKNPSGVALDNSGNIIVADRLNKCIRKVTTSGLTSTISGKPLEAEYSLDAPVAEARFGEPFGVTVANNGSIYVSDINFHTIRRISKGFVATVAGTGTAGAADGISATFDTPTSVAIDNFGNFYVADAGNNKIRKMAPEARSLQYTHGWNISTPFPGVTRYRFTGNRFFLPSAGTNKSQNVNVLDIDLSINHLEFLTTATDNVVTGIVGANTPALAAISGTYATTQYGPPGAPNRNPTGYVRNNNVTLWSANIYKAGTNYWVYHEGYYYMDDNGTQGMVFSDMNQDPFNPGVHKNITTGAPILIHNSVPVEITRVSTNVWNPGVSDVPQNIRTAIAARTAIAIPAKNNHVLLINVDGLANGTETCYSNPTWWGMTTPDFAQFIQQYFHAPYALNLDGGGSSTMILKGGVNNGGIAGGLGVINYPNYKASVEGSCPGTDNPYYHQRTTMRSAISVIPN